MVAEEREPARVQHDPVELIPMDNQQVATVRRAMDDVVDDFDSAEVEAGKVAQRLVMVARHIDHPRAMLGLLEDAPHHVVVAGRPVPALAQLPAVDDVADEVEGLALGRLEKVEEQFGVAAGRTEMDVGNPNRAQREARLGGIEMARLDDPVGQLRLLLDDGLEHGCAVRLVPGHPALPLYLGRR